MVGRRMIRLKKRKPEWISNLLGIKFFGSCAEHHDLRKNEKNMYCIDCNLGFCKHCMTSSSSPHCLHQWLQICKYVYHDVVRLQDIQKHLDCSKIQTYKINGEKAVHLNPRPQSKETKFSKSKGGSSCKACGRHIQDLPNSFCSIACKVSVGAEMYEEKNHKLFSIPLSEFRNISLTDSYYFDRNDSYHHQDNAQENRSFIPFAESSEIFWLSSKLKQKKQSHKRKGIPRRSPLH